MKLYVGKTNADWFRYLANRRPSEINFWRPRPGRGEFRVLQPGDLFLFLLNSPINRIAGGGYFSYFDRFPLTDAWRKFGDANGAATLEEVRSRLLRIRGEPDTKDDFMIGSIILRDPFFWPEEEWLPAPEDWKPEIVQGKGYDLDSDVGRRLWQTVMSRQGARAAEPRSRSSGPSVDGSDDPILGGFANPSLVKRRLNQDKFRERVMRAYEHRCAITGEATLPALEAVHIRPFSNTQSHSVSNGILLRSDIHRLFDLRFITITPEYRVRVSSQISSDAYRSLHGRSIFLPKRAAERPDVSLLAWHSTTETVLTE